MISFIDSNIRAATRYWVGAVLLDHSAPRLFCSLSSAPLGFLCEPLEVKDWDWRSPVGTREEEGRTWAASHRRNLWKMLVSGYTLRLRDHMSPKGSRRFECCSWKKGRDLTELSRDKGLIAKKALHDGDAAAWESPGPGPAGTRGF